MNRALLPALALAILLALACGGGEDQPTANLTLTADLSQLPAGVDADEALGDAADILRQRVELYGITKPEITLGGDTITVTLEGIDERGAIDLLTSRGVLEFKREQASAEGLVVCKTLQGEEFGVPPNNVNPDPSSRSLARCTSLDKLGEPVWIDAEVQDETGAVVRLAGDHVEPGSLGHSDEGTALSMTFTPEGSTLIESLTRVLTGYHLGLFVDGQLVGAPRIQRAITDGTALISGFPHGQARILAAVLNAPPLQVSLTQSP